MSVISLASLVDSQPQSKDQRPPDPARIAASLAKSVKTANGLEPVLDLDYLVKGLLVRGEVSVTYGPSNCGKSTLASAIAMAAARGEPFAGMRTRRVATLHIAPEGARSIEDALQPHIGAGRPDDAEPCFIAPLRADLRDPLHVDVLICLVGSLEAAFDCDIGLILIDTLVLSIGDSDENSSRDITSAMIGAARLAARTRTHVATIHHTNKAGEMRGSSALLGNVDTVLEVSPQQDENGGPVCRLTQIKQKSMPKGKHVHFRLKLHPLGLDAEGDPRTTNTIEFLPDNTRTAPAKSKPSMRPGIDARQKAVLDALSALSGDATDGQASPVKADAIRDRCDPAPFDRCSGNLASFAKAVSRILDRLAADEPPRVVKDSEGYRLASRADVPSNSGPLAP